MNKLAWVNWKNDRSGDNHGYSVPIAMPIIPIVNRQKAKYSTGYVFSVLLFLHLFMARSTFCYTSSRNAADALHRSNSGIERGSAQLLYRLKLVAAGLRLLAWPIVVSIPRESYHLPSVGFDS